MGRFYTSVKKVALLGLAAGVLGACDQSVQPSSDPKIIGGRLAEARSYMVGLMSQGSLFCGGTLVAPDLVITAAHCVEGLQGRLQVLVGATSQVTEQATPEQLIEVEAIAVHPGFDEEIHNDIAMLKLKRSAVGEGQASVEPIELATDMLAPEHLGVGTVLGWGNQTSLGYYGDEFLREVALPIVPLSQCQEFDPSVNDTQICAGDIVKGGVDSCQGDSGGPLVVQKDGKEYFAGIVSYGAGCAQKQAPGVYTRVLAFSGWIADQRQKFEDGVQVISRDLGDHVKEYCYDEAFVVPFKFEPAGDSGSLSLSKSYAISGAFLPFEGAALEPVGSSSCQVPSHSGSLVSVGLASSAGSSETHFYAEVDGKSFIAGASAATNIAMSCLPQPTSKNGEAEFGQVHFSFNAGDSFNTLNIGEAFYFLSSKVISDADQVDPAHIKMLCDIAGYELRLLEHGDSKFAIVKGPEVDGGVMTFELFDFGGEEEGAFEFQLEPTSSMAGSMSLTNVSGTDLYTWELSCNRAFELRDEFGVRYRSVGTLAEMNNVLFETSAHRWGSIGDGETVKFGYQLLDQTSETAFNCSVNYIPLNSAEAALDL